MPLSGRGCAACVGALVVHVCVADMYGDERPRETVIATSPDLHATHDDRPAEQAVDHAIYARQVVAVATASGRDSSGENLVMEVARWRSKQNDHAQRMAAIRFYEMNGES